MSRIPVLSCSMYGHIERMALAVADDARAGGAEVTVKRVPETMPADKLEEIGAKTGQAAPVATPEELTDCDAAILGTPTRFGNMAGQMRAFLDSVAIRRFAAWPACRRPNE